MGSTTGASALPPGGYLGGSVARNVVVPTATVVSPCSWLTSSNNRLVSCRGHSYGKAVQR